MKKDFETDGMRNGEPIYCPVNAYGDCPYCDKNLICHIADPIEDCSDFQCFWSSWEEYDDADNVDPESPTDFSEDEISFAERNYGYCPEEMYDEVGYNPFSGAYDYDC